MMMRATKTLLVVTAMLIAGNAHTAVIDVAHATARQSGSVEVSVNVSANTDLGGINVRLDYDPSVFSSPSVSGGSILDSSHVLNSYAPEAGKLNVVAYAPLGSAPFASRSGTAFTITLQVDSSATLGTYPISFATGGPPFFTSSGLSDMNGNRVEHTAQAGSVDVRSSLVCDVNGDHQVNEADLLLLLQEWHQISAAPIPAADINWDTEVNEKDLLLLSRDWQSP